jgi:hypothetical protein
MNAEDKIYLLKKELYELCEKKDVLEKKLLFYKKIINDMRVLNLQTREKFIMNDIQNLITSLYCEYAIMELEVKNMKRLFSNNN